MQVSSQKNTLQVMENTDFQETFYRNELVINVLFGLYLERLFLPEDQSYSKCPIIFLHSRSFNVRG